MKFSIVMPMYKQSEKLIKRAIYSIINQTYTDWELIICDNGNEDINVIKLINSLRKNDRRIIYFKSKRNVGWPKGISLCLERANGDFMGFIADDDYLENFALERVYKEIEKLNPDVVWLGQKYDILEDGNFKTVDEDVPPYLVFEGRKKICKNLIRFFNNVYYNSMQHYIRIDLLNKYGINFYDKYISDCGGMTKVLSVAEKMVVLDEAFYHLTRNTSLTRGRYQVGFYKMFACQWESMIELLESEKYYDNELLIYLANRFEKNHLSNINLLCSGAPCRNDLYQNIYMSYKERFFELEKTLSNNSICEMIHFYGREDYFYSIITNLMNLLKNAYDNSEMIDEIVSDSKYLGDFVLGLFDFENGIINIARSLDIKRIRQIIRSLSHSDNISLYGYEILMKIGNKASNKIEDILEIAKLNQKYELRKQQLITKFGNNNEGSEDYYIKKIISIIFLCENIGKYIKDFINYLLNQGIDMKQIELIFINNSSTDNIDSNILEVERQYQDSIKIINLGMKLDKSEVVNIGISYSSTNYIGFIDTDDCDKIIMID